MDRLHLVRLADGGRIMSGTKNPPMLPDLVTDHNLPRFVVSAVSIGMSKYGLAGIEAALLMDQRWAPQNAMQLMAHGDKVSEHSCRDHKTTESSCRRGRALLGGC